MAFVTEITCGKCGETKMVTMGSGILSSICNDCSYKAKIQKRTIYLNGLKSLSVDERLSKIEEQLYDSFN